jgi:hypothetical protein
MGNLDQQVIDLVLGAPSNPMTALRQASVSELPVMSWAMPPSP